MDRFRLRMLTVNDVVKDYDAVMLSRSKIAGVFGPKSDWPRADLSLEQDLIDLGWHQKEFQRRSSFAYTVMSADESVCLGCVYIDPSKQEDTDATVIVWVRADSGIDEDLFASVKSWLQTDWPFQKVAYPGREISWQDYAKEN
ncbi:MAG: GNAT family N-acetyltransferase [Gammaproteobacteria bacterium]|nr:GNAT family N-acetyltransferase [Gammaproteobacteria bacterium]